MSIVGSIPNPTRPNEAFERQADLTVPGMYHFAVPDGPQCGSCIFFGPKGGGISPQAPSLPEGLAHRRKGEDGLFRRSDWMQISRAAPAEGAPSPREARF